MSIDISPNIRLSGLILRGRQDVMVGLSDSQWLRIPLDALPELKALSDDELLELHIPENHLSFYWPHFDLSLSVSDFAHAATSIEDGSAGPK